ncbi:MAG: Trk family potassium uptake protein [Planctomycetes bacterium]|nr:Trk family potassium uptake protein [Planctomycetota bacterium]NUQ34436.1 Trk family potassium uptake protein [Planctomycetaceae bacterium]
MAHPYLQTPYRIEVANRLLFLPELVATVAAFAIPVIEYGFEPDAVVPSAWFTPATLIALGVLLLRLPAIYLGSSTLQSGFSRCTMESWWALISLIACIVSFVTPWSFESASRLAVLGFAVLRVVSTLRAAQRLIAAPMIVFAGAYLTLIFTGAGLLLLPRATQPGVVIGFVDALFMSASATCVTGLSLYDIGVQFTTFGQLIILALIQIGGMGIMTFAAFLSIAFGAGMSVRDRVTMGEVLNIEVIGKVGRLIFWIFGLTLVSEALGAAFLYGNWVDNAGNALAEADQLYYSIFHSISAFCNAGFGLHGDSLVRYSGQWPVLFPIAALIVIGGIGFTVIIDILRYKPWHLPAARRLPLVGKSIRRHPLPRLSLQTKLVLLTTFLLIVVGSVSFWLLERNNTSSLGTLDASAQVIDSLFQGGVTPRTAGFNSLDYSAMETPAQFFTMVLMAIGGSPGSAAGGIKTTVFAVLVLVLWQTFRGRPVEMFKRRVADHQVRHVLVVVVTALIVINSAVFLLTCTEDKILAMERGFEVLTFEVVSAFGTVGLSLGATANLSDTGKVVITVCMFLGRIGPLALVFGIAARRQAKFDYPTESIMLG